MKVPAFLFKGTVLDRIDFNVEQACVKTEDGLKQLQKVQIHSHLLAVVHTLMDLSVGGFLCDPYVQP